MSHEITIYDVEQGSREWLELRAGRFTATEASTIKTAGKGLETICLEKAAFWITGEPPETFETPAMRWGKEYESVAREAYRKTIWQEVKTVGFCALDEYVGCSPDGLVGDDGLCEIKCKQVKAHLQTIISEYVDLAHYGQMQFQMLVTGREWCDYVCYNPFFTNPLFVRRIYRDEDYIAKLKSGLEKGREMIKDYIKKYEESCL